MDNDHKRSKAKSEEKEGNLKNTSNSPKESKSTHVEKAYRDERKREKLGFVKDFEFVGFGLFLRCGSLIQLDEQVK
jgi:hypothetical protein